MAKATASQIADMDAAQGEVERVLAAAELRTYALENNPLGKWWLTDSQEASIANVKGLRRRFNDWIDGQQGPRLWAIDGRTEAGHPYTPQEWTDFGRELGEIAAKEAELSLRHNLFTLYTPAGAVAAPITAATVKAGVKAEVKVREVADTVAEGLNALNPNKPWSLKTKLAVGGVVTLVVLGTVGYFASSLAPLLALVPSRNKEGAAT